MRTIELGRTAAQAELLRIKRLIRRQAMRGVWGAVAALFGVAVLVMVHVVAFIALALVMMPIWAAIIVFAFDLVFLVVFGLMAASSKPGAIETEAKLLRDRAIVEMRESLAVGALVSPVGRVLMRTAGRGALNAVTPKFMSRKRR